MMITEKRMKVLALLVMFIQAGCCLAQGQTSADMLTIQETKAARAGDQWFKVETTIHSHRQYGPLNKAITRILFGKEKATESLEDGWKQHMAEYDSTVDPNTLDSPIGQREKMVVEFKGGDEKHYLNYFVGYMQLAIQGKETVQKNRERNFVFDIVHNKVLSLGDVLKPEVVEQIKGDAGKATIHMAMDNEALTVSYKKNGKMTSRTYVYHTQKDVFVDNIKELVDWAAVEKREQDILAQNAKLQKEIEEAYGGVIKWTEKDKLERVPSFPGGDQAMMMWVFRNLKYPAEAKAKGIRGNVICAFIVEPDGQLSTVKVIKGLDPDLDAEAIRLVNAMPKWTPGKQNGEPVRVRYDLTVNFFMR
jgi:TonB family protein